MYKIKQNRETKQYYVYEGETKNKAIIYFGTYNMCKVFTELIAADLPKSVNEIIGWIQRNQKDINEIDPDELHIYIEIIAVRSLRRKKARPTEIESAKKNLYKLLKDI